MTLRDNLKSRLAAGETIVAPGAYDPMSARVVQSLGFDTVYVGGYMSGAHLAVTEPLMTLTEQVDVAQRVAKSVPLPVICDAGAGYGDPVHTMHTVRTFERAGICGIHIEDQVFPKRASYHAGLEHVIPIDEFLEKMRYALQARSDPNFLIIGRTDSFTAVEGDMDDAIRRGIALRDLGVDVVMPRGVRQREGSGDISGRGARCAVAGDCRNRRHHRAGVRGSGLQGHHLRHPPRPSPRWRGSSGLTAACGTPATSGSARRRSRSGALKLRR